MTRAHRLARARLAVVLAKEAAACARNLAGGAERSLRIGALSIAAHDLAGGDWSGARAALIEAAYWRRASLRRLAA